MFLFLSEGAANQPDENQSGRDDWTNRQVGPARSEMIRHPDAGTSSRAKRRCMTGAIRRMSEAVALDERIAVHVTSKSDAPTGPEHRRSLEAAEIAKRV
jgi:hypothetical protein